MSEPFATATPATPASPVQWRRPSAIRNVWLRAGLIILAVAYLAAAIYSLPIDWSRMARGAKRGLEMISQFLQPDFTSRWGTIWTGLWESVAMTVVATIVGVALSIPVAIGAARNLCPWWVRVPCRSLIAVSRAFHELIVAIVLVKLVSFGPLAGVLTLCFATIGFYSKLLADTIEGIDREPLEAIRATGASWLQLVMLGVLPQVKPRMIGLALYRMDINFRESAVLGVVGAGGIGATLMTAVNRYDYDVAGAILLVIVVLVLGAEFISSRIRKRLV